MPTHACRIYFQRQIQLIIIKARVKGLVIHVIIVYKVSNNYHNFFISYDRKKDTMAMTITKISTFFFKKQQQNNLINEKNTYSSVNKITQK